jgi:sulfite reductase beta subunit-like hemoprotein
VPDERIAALGQSLAVIGLGRGDADTVLDVGSCPGAESCKLAVTRSRGAAQLVNDHFSGQPALVDALGRLDVRVSGCPNGCGLHHVAAIGLQGAVRKLGGRAVPQYFVLAGGDPRPDHGGSFGRVAAKVPARRVGLAIERLARHYLERRRPGEDAARFFARVDLAQLKLLLRDLEELGPEAARAEDFIDLGEAQPFRPETTDGECVA